MTTASTTAPPPTAQTKTPTAKTVDLFPEWKVEKNTKYKFTYKYPVSDSKYTWTSFVTENPSSSQLYQLGEYVNNAGVGLAINGLGQAGAFQPFLFKIEKTGTEEDKGASNWTKVDTSYYKMKSKTSVKKNGISGTRWEYQSLNEANSDFIRYQITKDGMTYYITIEGKADGIDLLKYGEQIYSTFNFI
jgi:hypothetical protein